MKFVQVAEYEGEEPVELPTEEDGTLLQSTLQSQYPGSCGLKYRIEATKAFRGVRLKEGLLHPPSADSGWGSQVYFCVFPKVCFPRNQEKSTGRTKRAETTSRCTDLIVRGLPSTTTDQSLREYFEQFGNVTMAQAKMDPQSGLSKGFGFIRFACYEAQQRVLATRHLIDGRWCKVKVSTSKQAMVHRVPCKVFVRRCTDDMTAEDLRAYFSQFGQVTYVLKPIRGFSLVRFLDPEVAQSLCGRAHIVKGVSVHVTNAAPKSKQNGNNPDHGNCGNNGSAGMGVGAIGNVPVGGNGYNPINGGRSNSASSAMSMQQSYTSQTHGDLYARSQTMPPQQYVDFWNTQQQHGNLHLANMQALGINPLRQNPSTHGQSLNNALGVGLPMRPAVAATAQHHQLGPISGLHNLPQGQGAGGGNGQNSQGGASNQSAGYLSWMTQAAGAGGQNGRALQLPTRYFLGMWGYQTK